MPELSLQKLREMIHAPLAPLDKAVGAVFPFEAQPQAPRDDTVLYQTKAGPITRGDLERGIEAGMGVSGGGLSTKGIKAYHSSPHDFDKFDLRKIGSGEGQQVYGHGLYFAESPQVSGQGGQYWEQFMNRMSPDEQAAAGMLRNEKFDRQKAIEYSNWNLNQLREGAERGELNRHMMKLYEARQRQHDLLQSDKPVGPRTYEVNIKAEPEQMLNWDKPLGEQPGHIIDVMRPQLAEVQARAAEARATRLERGANAMGRPLKPDEIARLTQPLPSIEQMTGKTAYGHMGLPAATQEEAFMRATQRLSDAGVPGIRYLDAGSRAGMKAAADRTSNYVVFDPSTIDIMKKYGIAGMAAPALGYGAMRGDE